MSTPDRSYMRAVASVFAGTAVYALIFASAKLSDGLVSVAGILWLRYAGAVMTLVMIAAVKRKALASFRSKNKRLHFLRAIFAVLGVGLVIAASAEMPVMDASAISMFYIVILVVLGATVMRESVNVRTVSGMATSTVGAVIVVRSGGAFSTLDISYIVPALVALLAAVFMAAEGLLLKITSRSDCPDAALLHLNGFALLLTTVPCALLWSPAPPLTVLGLLLLGPLAVAAQHLALSGYRQAPLSVVAPIDYGLLLSSGLIGILLLDERPTSGTVLGSAVIVAGGIMIAMTRSPERLPPESVRSDFAPAPVDGGRKDQT